MKGCTALDLPGNETDAHNDRATDWKEAKPIETNDRAKKLMPVENKVILHKQQSNNRSRRVQKVREYER